MSEPSGQSTTAQAMPGSVRPLPRGGGQTQWRASAAILLPQAPKLHDCPHIYFMLIAMAYAVCRVGVRITVITALWVYQYKV
eukprot:6201818-Pleurochrysis_carterae.AAC.1